MLRKLLQAVVITVALYGLMGLQSQGNSTPQASPVRSLYKAKMIDMDITRLCC